MTTGARVKQLIEAQNISLRGFAKKYNIPYSTLQTAIGKDMDFSVGTLDLICKGLGITMSKFFEGWESDCA